jgi:superfamily II DNA or RNA helicase
VELRPFQKQAVSAVMNDLTIHRTLAVVAPTGSGKTVIFGAIVKEYQRRHPTKKVMIVSHLGLLVKQTAERLGKEWGLQNIGILQASVYPSVHDKIIITTMQSLREDTKSIKWANNISYSTVNDLDDAIKKLNVGLLIIDEMHLSGCTSYQDIISMFSDSQVVGFTATPFRSNKLMTNIFEKVSYTISMQDLIELGFLVEPIMRLTPFDPFNLSEMYASMIKIYREKHLHQKALVYLRTIDEAKLCRNMFVDAGITCESVTSNITGNFRDDILERFRDGQGPDILTTVDVLTAGFDSPNVRAIFMPYKIQSVTTFLQRIGRGLRPFKGKTHCDVYVGSDMPDIEKGFWEKITKQMLNQGKKSYDNLEDLVAYGENDFSAEEYSWTKEVVSMAKSVQNSGMKNLFDLIVTKRLPDSVLREMIKHPPLAKAVNIPASQAQINMLYSLGLKMSGKPISKGEASALIQATLMSRGQIEQDEIVHSGLHKGKHYSQVPNMYWGILAQKSPQSGVYQSYLKYKDKVMGRIHAKNNSQSSS